MMSVEYSQIIEIVRAMDSLSDTLTLLEILKFLALIVGALIGGFIWLMRIKWSLDSVSRHLAVLEKQGEGWETALAHLKEREAVHSEALQNIREALKGEVAK